MDRFLKGEFDTKDIFEREEEADGGQRLPVNFNSTPFLVTFPLVKFATAKYQERVICFDLFLCSDFL